MTSQETNKKDKDPSTFVTIFETTNTVQWRLVRDLLLEKEFAVRALGGELTGAHIGVGQQSVTHRIQVEESEAVRAEEEVAAYLKEDIPEDKELEELAITAGRGGHPRVTSPILNMKELELRRIQPLSAALSFALVALVGTLLFLGFAVFLGLSLRNIPFVLIIAAVPFGLLSGFLGACAYNLGARWFGGVNFVTFDATMLFTKDFQPGNCFYQDSAGQIQGPFSQAQLKEKHKEGELQDDDLVQCSDEIRRASTIV